MSGVQQQPAARSARAATHRRGQGRRAHGPTVRYHPLPFDKIGCGQWSGQPHRGMLVAGRTARRSEFLRSEKLGQLVGLSERGPAAGPAKDGAQGCAPISRSGSMPAESAGGPYGSIGIQFHSIRRGGWDARRPIGGAPGSTDRRRHQQPIRRIQHGHLRQRLRQQEPLARQRWR